MYIGKKLKYLRLGQNKTQKDISDFLNITPNAYQKYELNTREPSLYILSRLVAYHDVSYDFLFGAGVFKNWEDVEKHWAGIISAVVAEFPYLAGVIGLPRVKVGNILNNFVHEIIIDDASNMGALGELGAARLVKERRNGPGGKPSSQKSPC